MTCDLVVMDCFGREVILEHSNWEKHRDRHGEVIEYHDSFPLVLQDPDFVVEAARDGDLHYYQLGIVGHRYLQLVVRSFVGAHKVTTWWFSPKNRTKGTVIYERQ